jgi:phage repressor protein C with HTH and peptisase S24 domain
MGHKSARAFAIEVGIDPSGFRKSLSSNRISYGYLSLIAQKTGIEIGTFIGANAATDVAAESYIPIPRFDVHASAGRGRIPDRDQVAEIEPVLALRQDFLRRIGIVPGMAHLLTASGDSMQPTIHDGDLIIADRRVKTVAEAPGGKPSDRPIYVVTWNDAVLVKRATRVKGGVLLTSDNPAYAPEMVPSGDLNALSVEGRVRWIARST